MEWRISRALLEQLCAGERAEKTREICGLLLADKNGVLSIVPVPNGAANPRRAFMLEPAAHLAVSRAARASGLKIVGHYHSHPGGNPLPSLADADQAEQQGQLWLILAGGTYALWQSCTGGAIHGAFEQARLFVDEV